MSLSRVYSFANRDSVALRKKFIDKIIVQLYNNDMEILIDACAILAVLLDDEEKDFVLQKTENSLLIAPDCIDYEIGNALTSLIKRKKISTQQAIEVFEEYQKVLIRKEKTDIKSAINLAGKNNMYAYDAYYLNCAVRHNIPLLSLDGKLVKIAKAQGVVCL